MTYQAFEESKEGGQPVELFEFTIGGTVFRYTSAEDTVTFAGNTYTSVPTIRSAPQLTSTTDGRAQLEITLPATNQIAARYIGIVPAEPVFVEAKRFHRGDPLSAISFWKGRIASAKFTDQGGSCILFSVSSESALSRAVPGRKFQSLCNHRLYDSICQVVRANFKHTNTCTLVAGSDITVTGIGSLGATWAVGGVVEFGAEKRLVISQTGNVLTLRLPFPEDITGQIIDVFAGCDHSLTTCTAKFNNAINFGGFPYVPTSNPFNTGL